MIRNATIGIDLGTSGCRAIVIDDAGNIIATSRQLFDPQQINSTEQNPDYHWQTVKTVLANVIRQIHGFKIEAICVDATSGSVVVASKKGKALTPLLMYNDSRAVKQSQLIKIIAPAHSAAHGATSGLAKLLYLNTHHQFTTDTVLMHQADWINAKLGAHIGITDENNALKTGYDPIERCWPHWISTLHLKPAFPTVVPSGSVIGQLSPTLVDEFQLTNQPNLIAGTTDSIAALIATNSSYIGNAVTSLGSSLVVKLISDSPVFIPEQGVYSHRLGNKWLVGGASNTGGAVLAHYFSSSQLQQLSEQIDLSKKPAVNYYPLLTNGERFPINDPDKPGILSPRPKSDIDFLHGLLDGMARIEQLAYQCLEQAGASPLTSITTVGGGSINTTWQAIRQHYINVPFLTAEHTEAAYGSAQIARGYLSTFKD
ncbi:MAG: FGGY-family carbohydrate kinase [Gammaproteobacteria bacterium]|nr:FGGY-family carbohydrate kinase [Gammaproteobacteria bacterium]